MIAKPNHKKSEKDRNKTRVAKRSASFLLDHGIRPTKQRLSIATFLFDGKHHHVTADQLMVLAKKKKAKISLATIYNSIHQFVAASILTEVALDSGTCRYFDTNLVKHSHFFCQEKGRLWDIDSDKVSVDLKEEPPAGMEIDSINVVVYLKKSR